MNSRYHVDYIDNCLRKHIKYGFECVYNRIQTLERQLQTRQTDPRKINTPREHEEIIHKLTQKTEELSRAMDSAYAERLELQSRTRNLERQLQYASETFEQTLQEHREDKSVLTRKLENSEKGRREVFNKLQKVQGKQPYARNPQRSPAHNTGRGSGKSSDRK